MPSFFSRSRSDSHPKLCSRKVKKSASLRFKHDTVSTCTDAESSTAPSSFSSQVDIAQYKRARIYPAQGRLTESDGSWISHPTQCQGEDHYSDLSSLTSNTFSFTGNAAAFMSDAMIHKNSSSGEIKPRQNFYGSEADWGYFVDVVEDQKNDAHSQFQDHSTKGLNFNASELMLCLENEDETSIHEGLSDDNCHQSLSLEASLARFYGLCNSFESKI